MIFAFLNHSVVNQSYLMKANVSALRKLFSAAMLTCLWMNAVWAGAQFSVDRSLQWSATLRPFNSESGISYNALSFAGASFSVENTYVLPQFQESFPISGSLVSSATLTNTVFSPVTELNGKELEKLRSKLSKEIQVHASVGFAQKQPEAIIDFIPLRINPSTNVVEKLVSFTLTIQTSDIALKTTETTDVTGISALSSGRWYKISLTKEGIYKIDKDFLTSLGISGSISFSTLGVFGNGGGMLPESNADFRYDDIQENSIYKFDANGNNIFDDGDYILFYGQAPHRFNYIPSENTFRHQNNIYSDKTCYFISPDKGTGKFITGTASLPVENYTTSTYDIIQFIDADKSNLLSSGRAWYGDAFDIFNPSRDYIFTFPDLVAGSTMQYRIEAAGNSPSGSIILNLSANGTSLPVDIVISQLVEGFTETYAYAELAESAFTTTGSSVTIGIDFSGSSTSTAWLDYIELLGRAQIKYAGSQLMFRDLQSIAPGRITKFSVQANTGVFIWDVTDQTQVKSMDYSAAGGVVEFITATDSLREFIVFEPANAYSSDELNFEQEVANQNIHNDTYFPDYVIVTHPSFLSEARRLAAYHYNVDGLDTLVVTTTQVYNEFSSGVMDLSAIRDMMRMFYVRAGADADKLPRYLLVFGDASFDYRNITYADDENTMKVPTFESPESLQKAYSYCTDDYMGFLDVTEGDDIESTSEKLDIGIGRLPCVTIEEAGQLVDKIMHYSSPESLGSWRNNLSFLADDEDYNTHVEDANLLAIYMEANHPVYNLDKIYFDSYQQIPGAGGERYPEVETAINNKLFTGSLIMNYLGHGNEQNWAQERVLSVDDINSWTNYDKLPLFITATCSFSRYDNPGLRSAGELVIMNPRGGGIALMTTVRLVYASANYDLNSNFIEHLFDAPGGINPRLGDAVRLGKNAVTTQPENNRKFILLGDPGVMLNYPKYQVQTKTVNGYDITVYTDTLKALDKVTITGEVTDESGEKLTGFNGIVYPAVYDKPVLVNNLVNDPTFSGVGGYGPSEPFSFYVQKNALYKGKASVVNGDFSFTFIVPKDISYSFGSGKLSYYADNGLEDAHGFDTEVIIGGTADDAVLDDVGPEVEVYMNDETFVLGGLTDENPILLIKLSDSSGINALGNAVGHDITATLDEDQQTLLKLNEYYESDLDQYQTGSVVYPLSDIATGRHTVSVKAWDVHNNSGDGYTEFIVAETADLALSHVLNYPNPFTDNTSFWFEHNRPGDLLDVKVEVFTVSGKRVITLQQQVVTDGYRVDSITWDGRDAYGDPIGKGVYVYKVSVKAASDNSSAQEFQKLVILK